LQVKFTDNLIVIRYKPHKKALEFKAMENMDERLQAFFDFHLWAIYFSFD